MKTDPSDNLFAAPTALLHDVLAVSLTAVDLLRPLYGPDGTELSGVPQPGSPAHHRAA